MLLSYRDPSRVLGRGSTIGWILEFYPDIRLAHISTVVASGVLFAFRGAFVSMGAAWPMIPPLRFLSYGIDTVLAATAVLLVTMVPASVYGNGWLALKLSLLVAYIVLGSFALKRGRTPRGRRAAFAAAILVFLTMFAVARAHHPLGAWIIVRGWLT